MCNTLVGLIFEPAAPSRMQCVRESTQCKKKPGAMPCKRHCHVGRPRCKNSCGDCERHTIQAACRCPRAQFLQPPLHLVSRSN